MVTLSIVKAARAYGYDPDTAERLPHPWGIERAFRVRALARPDAALKVWSGDPALARLKREVQHLDHLGASGFRSFARMLPAADGRRWVEAGDGLGWSAYEYVAGPPLDSAAPASAHVVGRLLASLHRIGPRERPSPSRLDELDAIFERAQRDGSPASVCAAMGRGARPELRLLPRACIHGDFNLENILLRQGEPVLIDFEFARWDVRLFDFAALVAPFRRPSGAFARASDAFLNAVADAYDEQMGEARLTARERSLFGVAAVVHALFIVADLESENSPLGPHARSLLESILRSPPRLR
jgi:Ser/Thr protein kinase RdoA (MazF antagonist)